MMRSHFSPASTSKFENRGVVNVRHAFDAGHAVAFQQETQNHLGFLDRQIHSVQMVFPRLQERLRALAALIALVAFTVTSFALTFDPAGMAGHFAISLDRADQKPDNGLEESVRLRSRGF